MKAIMYHRYGTPDVLACQEAEKPTPEDTLVLIRVRAASVNPLECGAIRGAARFVNGLRKPKNTRIGVDVAGEVEEVGRNVTQFQSGLVTDRFYGFRSR
jgi:NADPH:quinone reductase-like Zn-dependent oxidoreductase